MGKQEKPHVLTIGLSEEILRFVAPIVKDATSTNIQSEEFEKILEVPPTPSPCVIVCGELIKEITPYELAQSLRSQYQEIPILFVSAESTTYEKALLLKNGYTDTFILVIDKSTLKQALMDALAKAGNVKSYRAIKVVDIQPDAVTDFDVSVYLPMNKKHVLFNPAGEPMGKERAEKLNKHQVTSLYVSHDQLNKFYQYASETLNRISSDDRMSETERKYKSRELIRSVLSDALDASSKSGSFDKGKAILADCKKIVSGYVMKATKSDWLKQMLTTMDDENDSYSHTSNVSSYAAMLSVGLGEGKPEDLAIAGLLHDIGLGRIPYEIQEKRENELSAEQLEQYKTHVNLSLELIKQQKIVLNKTVEKIIQQHHEMHNGEGYPLGLTGGRICVEAQILAFADQFDYLTAVVPGRPRVGIVAALDQMQQEESGSAGKRFNPTLFSRIVELFKSEKS